MRIGFVIKVDSCTQKERESLICVRLFSSLFTLEGKLTYIHVFFFGETAERSWIQTTRILPFVGPEKLTEQRHQWCRQVNRSSTRRGSLQKNLRFRLIQMKRKKQEEQKLSFNDKSNLKMAIRQTVKLSQFSLGKRISLLKYEWWYWNNGDLPLESKKGYSLYEHDPSPIAHDQEADMEDMPDMLSTNSNDPVQTRSIGFSTTNTHLLVS